MSEDAIYGSDPRPIPRIARVEAGPGQVLTLSWQDGRTTRVDLSGWIGLHDISELRDEAVFSRPEMAEYGSCVQWAGNEDLSIDTVHLEMLAEQQADFTAKDVAAWQNRLNLSNREAADLLGVAPSTWSLYKAGGAIPAAVRIACRAVERDPVLLEAHFKPRRPPGRPTRSALE
jgi:Protein of unknown function (DUF2442)